MRDLIVFILRSLAFLIAAAVVYAICIFIWGTTVNRGVARNLAYPKGGNGHMWSRLKEANDHGRVDILVLGSSLAYRGFDPRQFAAGGYTLFNLGSSNQTFIQSEVLVDRYLDRLDPALIIIEVNPWPFHTEGVESAVDLIANGSLDLELLKMTCRVGNIKTLNALVYAIERKILELDNDFVEPIVSFNGENSYVSGGFVEHVSGNFQPKRTSEKLKLMMRSDQLSALERILAKLGTQGRKVVLVQAPLTAPRYSSFLDIEAHHAIMDSLATHIQFSGMEGLVDSLDFYDEGHLNQQGVVKFNAAVLDSLARLGLLPRSIEES